ncbi:MAG: hypothetical protein MHM6MM_002936 [Cercozoa sp. M6MM]
MVVTQVLSLLAERIDSSRVVVFLLLTAGMLALAFKFYSRGLRNKSAQVEKKWFGKLDPNLWYLDGKAYDFTSFADRHPGGLHALWLGKGRDCSGLFHSYHLRLPSQEVLNKYLAPEDKQPKIDTTNREETEEFYGRQKFTFDKNGFYSVLKQQVVQHFDDKGIDWKSDNLHWFFAVLNVVLQLGSLVAILILAPVYGFHWSTVLAALVHAFGRSMTIVQATHGGSHFALSRNPAVNRWWYRIGTVLIAMWAPPNWDLQHVVAHHIYTNEWPFDSDSAFPLKSIAANQRRFWYHKYQHIYAWLIYAFVTPLVQLNAIKELVTGKQVTFRMRYDAPGLREEGIICSILGFCYQIMPLVLVPFGQIWHVWFLTTLAHSLFFSLQFVINHEIDEVHDERDATRTDSPKPLPSQLPQRSTDWGAYQCEESFSFAPHSRLALYLSGGLNTQIEHHLFPGVHFSHYKDIAEITRRVAKKFGVPYRSTPTLPSAWRKHYNLLKNPPTAVKRDNKKSK